MHIMQLSVHLSVFATTIWIIYQTLRIPSTCVQGMDSQLGRQLDAGQ